jgi:hypothetical protein
MASQEREHMLLNHYDRLKINHESSSILIHDVKKHVNALEQLYEVQNIDAARNYASDFKKVLDLSKKTDLYIERITEYNTY